MTLLRCGACMVMWDPEELTLPDDLADDLVAADCPVCGSVEHVVGVSALELL